MKQRFTQAKKARRASAFHKFAGHGGQSKKRALLREDMQPSRPQTFGYQVARLQRIFLKKDRFGKPIYKYVPHAVLRTRGPIAGLVENPATE